MVVGSPPRVWGILDVIPPGSTNYTVHPHACGEYTRIAGWLGDSSGSPPRVWGIRSPLHHHQRPDGSPPRVWGIRSPPRRRTLSSRFTPTRVGNTLVTLLGVIIGYGSPPRVWGIRLGKKPSPKGDGSPPRVWGILSNVECPSVPSAVHPHACGEYVHCIVLQAQRARFTPTRVGNTYHARAGSGAVAVHPHACGEYVPLHGIGLQCLGSPPRVWGILLALCGRPSGNPVHPHACGEYV